MPKQDAMVRDIRNNLKVVFKAAPKYAKGTAQLFLASGKAMIDADLPYLQGMYEVNKDLLTDVSKFLRNPADAINKSIDRALNTEGYKELTKFAKYAIDDLKTGNLYDPARMRSIDDSFGSMDDFGGFDMSEFDENGDWKDLDFDDKNIEAEVKIAEVQEENASKRTEATIGAIGTATEAVVNTNNANTQLTLRTSMKQHAQQMNAFQNMITSQNATFELINRSINAQLDVTREAHNQVMSKMDEMTNLLTEIRDGIVLKPNEEQKRQELNIFGTNGELNIRNYIKQVGKNIDDKFGLKGFISMMTQGMDMKTMIQMIEDNPWQLLTDQILNTIVPKNIRQQMELTNRSMGGFFPALLQKMRDKGKKFATGEGGLDTLIASILGIEQRSQSTIDTAYKGYLEKANITGKTVRAIEEVIPMWLSRIYSAVSGAPLQVYNYSTGRLERVRDVISSTEHEAKDLVGRMGDSARHIMDRASRYNFKTSQEKENFEKFVYQYLQQQAEDSNFVNPYISKDTFMENMPSVADGNRDDYYSMLVGILKAMPRDIMIGMSRDIQSARLSRNSNNERLNKALRESGLNAAYGFGDYGEFSEISSATMLKRTGLGGDEVDKLLAKRNKDLLEKGIGVRATNNILTDILATLRKGIITYTYNLGTSISGEGASLPDGVGSLIKSVMDESVNQRAMEEKLARKIIDDEQRKHEILANERARSREDMLSPNRPESKYYVEHGITPDFAEEIQHAINIERTAPGESNNPHSEAHRKWLEDHYNELQGKVVSASRKSGIAGVLETVKLALNSPFTLFDKGMKLMDAFLFKSLFGEDALGTIDLNSDEPQLLQVLTNSLHMHFVNATKWFTENVGNPLKHMLLDKDEGILPRVAKKLGDIFDIDGKKQKVSEAASKLKTRLIGEKVTTNVDGKDVVTGYTGGRFSKYATSMVEMRHRSGDKAEDAIDRLLYGKYASTKGVRRVTNRDEKGRFTAGSHKEYDGVIGNIKHGFDSFSTMMFGEDQNSDSRQKWKTVMGEINKALPEMTIGAGAGLLASFILPGGPLFGAMVGSAVGLTKGSDEFRRYLFGNTYDSNETDPVTGKPRIVKRTDRSGIFSKEVYEGLAKYAPKMTTGAMIGAIAGGLGLLPFGMGTMAGSLFGSIGTMIGSSDQVREIIFGKAGDDDDGILSKNFRKNVVEQVKKYAPPALAGGLAGGALGSMLGAGLGLIPGLALLPTGPIFSIMGSLMGLSNTETINKFLFGTEAEREVETVDDNGNKVKTRKTVREGGLFGGIHDFTRDKLLKPFADKVNVVGDKIGNWFKESIVDPLDRSAKPLKEEMSKAGNRIMESMKNIGATITNTIHDVFEKAIGIPIGDFFKNKVIKPMEAMTNRLFSAIGKIIGGIISAPFRALEFIVTGGRGGSDDLDREHEAARAERHNAHRAKMRERGAERAGGRISKAFGHFGDFMTRITGFNFKDPDKMVPQDAEYNISGSKISADQRAKNDDLKSRLKAKQSGVQPDVSDDPKNGSWLDLSNPYQKRAYIQYLQDGGSGSKSDWDKYWRNRRRNKTSNVNNAPGSDLNDKMRQSEAATRERTTRATAVKTNNDYLKDIAKYTKKTYEELKGQVNGVGWNTAYIRTMLMKQYGELDDAELPEEMEGSKRQIRKRRTIFGRVKDYAAGKFSDAKDAVFRFGSAALDKVKGTLGILFAPIKWIFESAKALGNVFKTFGGGLLELLKTIGGMAKEILLGAAKGLGNILAGIGRGLGKAADGLVGALGNVAYTLTGVLGDLTLGLSSLALGLVETVATIAPDVAGAAWKGLKFVGRGAKNFVVGATKGIGASAGWAFDKITGRNKEKTKIRNLGVVKVDGGHLDKVDDSINIKIGDPMSPKLFPWTSVFNGISPKKITDAIPVYILGVDPAAHMNINNHDATNPSNSQSPSQTRASHMLREYDDMSDEDRAWYLRLQQMRDETNRPITLWSGPNGTMMGPNGQPVSVTRPYDPLMEVLNNRNKSNNSDAYVRAYVVADRAAERSRNPAEVYDRQIKNAKSREEIEAIQAAQQLNVNNQQINAATGSNTENKNGGWLETLMTQGVGGLVSQLATGAGGKLATAVGGTGIGAALLGALGAAKSGVSVATGSLIKNIPFLAGTGMALSNGDYDRVTTNLARKGISVAQFFNKFATNKVAQQSVQALTNANPATAATGISKLASGFRSALSKVMQNGLIKKALEKINFTKIASIVNGITDKFNLVLKAMSGEAVEKLLQKANWIVMVATVGYDLFIGWNDAANTFKISAGDVTTGMRVSSALARAVSGLAFGLIPASWIAEFVYNLVAGKEAEQRLDENQANVKAAASTAGMSVDDYLETTNGKTRGLVTIAADSISNAYSTDSFAARAERWGRGMRHFSQRSTEWNRADSNMATAGCGPTAAAMVASAYGKSGNPAEANQLSYRMGMRAADGGTNPAFFSQYAAGKGYGMQQGPTSSRMISSNLSKGRPVVLMGKGGPYGSGMHYLVADGISGKGRVNVVDPITGGSRSASMRSLMKNTSSTIYSYGRGPSMDPAQDALVNKMMSVEGQLDYSLDWDKQDPDKVINNRRYGSCASTVGWAYRNVLGINGMSANAYQQSTDDRFVTIYQSGIASDGSGNGGYNEAVMQPGDIIYYRRSNARAKTRPYHIGHAEMYAGNNNRIGHGGGANGTTRGPLVKSLNNDGKNIVMVRRLRDFVDGNTVKILNGADTSNTTNSKSSAADIMQNVIGLGGLYNTLNSMYDKALGALLGTNQPNTDGTSTDSTNYSEAYSNTTGSTAAATAASTAIGKTNGQRIWNFLKAMGMTDEAAAGTMSNLYNESGFDPMNVQDTYEKAVGSDKAYTNAVDKGSYSKFARDNVGYGLAQWTYGSRKAELLKLAKSRRASIGDLNVQLDHMWSELSNTSLLKRMNAANAADASTMFMKEYEMPELMNDPAAIAKRAADSQSFLEEYGTGPYTNVQALTNKVRTINSTISKIRSEAEQGSTIEQVTNHLVDTVKNATSNNDSTSDKMMQLLTSSLATMIELLSDIKNNTAVQEDVRSMKSSGTDTRNLPAAEAYPYDDTGVGTNDTDVGLRIVNALTSK